MATNSITNFITEVRRRRVLRVVALYVVGAWIILQAADLAFPGLGIPEFAIRYVWIATILAFPIALAIGWRFDIGGGRVLHTADQIGEAGLPLNRSDYLILSIFSFIAIAITVVLGAAIRDTSQPPNDAVSPIAVDAASVAVLAFDNMSPDADAAYFAEGISEEILNVLAGIDGLKVTSRTSAFSFRGTDTPIPEIARQLGVAHVLEGSVRKQAKRVRITAQLIDAQTDTHLWSEIFDRELSDVFAVQEEIAQAVAVALQDVLGVRNVRADNLTEDLEAYQLFLQGRQMFYERGDALTGAIEALRTAVERDPNFAAAWTFLAAAAEVAPDYVVSISEEEADVLADEASRMALELDPNLGFALAVRARLIEGRGDLIAALDLYRRATIANPDDSTIHLWFGLFNLSYGYLSEALIHLQRSYELDPLVRNTNEHLVTAYLASGQEARARTHFAKARELNGGFNFSYLNHLVLSGDLDGVLVYIDASFANRQPHGVRIKYLLVEALRYPNPASLNALLAEENATHGPEYVVPSIYFIVLNLRDRFFDHYSRAATTTPMYDLQPLWLPGNRIFVEDPRFFVIMSEAGADVLWEQHGYPDGCTRVGDPVVEHLDCAERYR